MPYLPLRHTTRLVAIESVTQALQKSGLEFDSIVCCGLSGALVAPAVAANLNKNLVIVRKGESTHGDTVEIDYNVKFKNYVIVDDLVETGKTITNIKKQISRVFNEPRDKVECVGVYFYSQAPTAVYYIRFKEKFSKLWTGASDGPLSEERHD